MGRILRKDARAYQLIVRYVAYVIWYRIRFWGMSHIFQELGMGVRCQSGFAHEKRILIDIVTKLVFRDEASVLTPYAYFNHCLAIHV